MMVLRGHQHGYQVACIVFSPKGGMLASCSTDYTVRLWDLRTGKGEILERVNASSVAFTPDGKALVWSSSYQNITLLHLATGRRDHMAAMSHNYTFPRIRFSPDGRLLASVGLHFFRILDMTTGETLPAWEGSNSTTGSLAFSPDGRTLATGHSILDPGSYFVRRYQHLIRLWDVATGKVRAELRGHTRPVPSLAFAPDGCTLAAACGPTLWVWDTGTGQPIFRRQIDTYHFKAVAFTPDGRYLAAIRNDRTVRFWGAAGWREGPAFNWGVGALQDLAFAADGTRAAAGSRRGKIVVWDVDL
jgi:WD40 repeat protein